MLHRGGLRTVMCVYIYIYWICRNNKNLGLLSDLAILEKKYQATINNILFFQILIPLYIELILVDLN